MDEIIRTLSVYALPVLLAITLHEAAHGYAALKFGDSTAYVLGRVTLNPLKHIDPIGTIAIPVALAIMTAGAFVFGYAKPVPVDVGSLRKPRRDMALVALAGPASNAVQALAWAILLTVLGGSGVTEAFFIEVARAGVLVNIVMAVFNLVPIPPLDGGRIAVSALPNQASNLLAQVEPYGFFIVMALVYTRVIDAIWMQPLMGACYAVLNALLTPLRAIFA
jgi:Zn-dependent protease